MAVLLQGARRAQHDAITHAHSTLVLAPTCRVPSTRPATRPHAPAPAHTKPVHSQNLRLLGCGGGQPHGACLCWQALRGPAQQAHRRHVDAQLLDCIHSCPAACSHTLLPQQQQGAGSPGELPVAGGGVHRVEGVVHNGGVGAVGRNGGSGRVGGAGPLGSWGGVGAIRRGCGGRRVGGIGGGASRVGGRHAASCLVNDGVGAGGGAGSHSGRLSGRGGRCTGCRRTGGGGGRSRRGRGQGARAGGWRAQRGSR